MPNPWEIDSGVYLDPTDQNQSYQYPAQNPYALPQTAAWLNGMQPQPNRQPAQQPQMPDILGGLKGNIRSRVLASGPPSKDARIRQLVESLLGQQQTEVAQQQKLADDYAAKPQQLNLAPLAAWIDSFTGGKTAQTYKQPESADERAITLAKLRQLAQAGQQNVTKDTISYLQGGEKNDTAAMRMLATFAGKNINEDLKTTSLRAKLSQNMGNDLNAYKQRATQLGNIANTLVRASGTSALLDRYTSGDQLIPSEVRELAIGLGGLITKSNLVHNDTIKGLVPKSALGDAQAFKQWVTGIPEGQQLGALVDRLASTVKTEADTSAAQLHELRRRTLTVHKPLYDMDEKGRDIFLHQARQGGIPKEEAEAILNEDVSQPLSNFQELPMGNQPGGVYSKAATRVEDRKAGKVWTKADVEAAAKRNNVPYDQAKKQIEGAGHAVTE